MSIMDKIESQINNVIKAKITIEPIKVMKKFGFKTKKHFNEDNKEVAIGNEGKVFDSLIIGSNKDGDKVVILINPKKDDMFYSLIETTNSKEVEEMIDALNNNDESCELVKDKLKNKSMKINCLYEKIIEIL